MNDVLILYRGDYDKIKKYQYSKTKSYCLLGKGIYLTDSIKVANSYRDKGSYESSTVVYFSGEAKDRTDAREKGFLGYCTEIMLNKPGKPVFWKPGSPEEQLYRKKYYKEYIMLIESGVIKVEYTQTKTPYRPAKLKVYRNNNGIGFLTSFKFNRQFLLANVLHVNQECHDESFWGLLWDNNISIGTQYADREAYVRNNKGTGLINSRLVNGLTQQQATAIQRVLTPYGIIGFAYSGGMIVGGFGKHQAYCLWDEDYVNEHRLDRTR